MDRLLTCTTRFYLHFYEGLYLHDLFKNFHFHSLVHLVLALCVCVLKYIMVLRCSSVNPIIVLDRSS
jgi:hypothetical protein